MKCSIELALEKIEEKVGELVGAPRELMTEILTEMLANKNKETSVQEPKAPALNASNKIGAVVGSMDYRDKKDGETKIEQDFDYDYKQEIEEEVSTKDLSWAVSVLSDKLDNDALKELMRNTKQGLEYLNKTISEYEEETNGELALDKEDRDYELIRENKIAIKNLSKAREELLKLIAKKFENTLGSDRDEMLSEIEKFDKEIVNKNNDPEVMMALAKYLNDLDKTGTSEAHKEHLLGVLETIVNPVGNFLKESTIRIAEKFEGSNSGMMDVKTGDIYIGVSRSNPNGTKKSALEVFVHELVHAATYYAENVNLKEAIHAKRMLHKMYDIAKNEITPEMLIPEVSIYGREHDLQEAKEMLDYIFNRDGKAHHGLAEFMAHGMTNEPFMNALSKLTVAHEKGQPKSFTERLHKWIKEFFDFVFSRDRSEARLTMDKAMQKFVIEMAQANNRAQHAAKEGIVSKALGSFNRYGEGLGTQMQDWFEREINSKEWWELSAQGVVVGNAKAILKVMNDKDKMDSFKKWLDDRFPKFFDQRGFIQTFVQGIQQKGTKIHKEIEGLLQLASTIQRQKEAESEAIIKNANEKFNKKLSVEEKISLGHVVVETDMSQLSDMSFDEMQELLKSDDALSKKARELIGSLGLNEEATRQYETLVEGIGYYMSTGNVAVVGPITNTKNVIAFVKEGDISHKAVLDKAATLFALKYTSKESRNIVSELMSTEPDGVANAMLIQKAVREKSEQLLFNDHGDRAISNEIQGYTRDIVDTDVDFVVAPLAQQEEMLKKGYKLVTKYKAHKFDSSSTVMAGYLSREAPKHPWNRSATIISDRGRRGTTLTELHTQNDYRFGRARAGNDILKYNEYVNKALQDMRKGTYKFDATRQELLPVLDLDGNIIDYRYTMNKASKTKYLQRNARFDEMLGKTQASVIEKAWAERNNLDIVDTLFKEMDEPEGENAKRVELDPDSEDLEIKELMKVMPRYMREYIEEELEKRFAGNLRAKGKNKKHLTVRKDMLLMAFGYRSFGISDVMDERIVNTHVKTFVRLLEMIWKDVVKLIKNTIVIKMPFVLAQNVMSNMNYMLMMGMSFTDAMKFQLDAAEGISEYISMEKELLALELEQRKGRDVSNDIRDIKNRMKKSNVRDLFEAGLFTGIVEDVDTNKEDPNKVARKMDEFMEKVPEPIRVGLDWFFVTKRTPVYQWMLKSTQYSDAVGRYAMIRHYTEKLGLSKEEAISRVRDDFVMYDIPDSKYLQYANDIGLVMFTKYVMRIQRVLNRGFVHNPLNFSMALVFSILGMDFFDPTDAMMVVNKGPLDMIKLPTDHLDTLINSNVVYNLTGNKLF